MVIWKYKVMPDNVNQVFSLPRGAEILSFGVDGANQLCFWALVNEQAPHEDRVLVCVGTGWPLTTLEGAKERTIDFIGSVTQDVYVWHLFEIVND